MPASPRSPSAATRSGRGGCGRATAILAPVGTDQAVLAHAAALVDVTLHTRSHRAVDGESTSTTRSGASGPAIPAGGARFGPPQVARVSRFGKCTAPMSTPTGPALMERLVSLCNRRGFIFQSSDFDAY